MLKAIIIDDEAPARSNLKEILKEHFREVEVIDEAGSVKSGVKLLKHTTPDIVFLDIDLSDGSGFNILEQLGQINFKVIFVTAYDTYAVKAFQFDALDYILKPIELKQLHGAIEKAKESLNKSFITKAELENILSNFSRSEEDRKLCLNESNKVSFIPIKDIVKLVADGSYTVFHFSDQTKKTTSKALINYEKQLPDNMFYRIHQSTVVNLNYIREFNKSEGGYVTLTDDTILEVARRRKDGLLALLQQKYS